MVNIDAMINWAVAEANDSRVGYSQPNRTNPSSRDLDCSRLVQLAMLAGGYPVTTGFFSTATMAQAMPAAGWPWHSGVTGISRGDVLWKPGHTAIYLGGTSRVEAWIDESGQTIGAVPGDQTGQEVRIHSPWNDLAWTGYFRHPSDSTVTTPKTAIGDDEMFMMQGPDAAVYLIGADGTIIHLPNTEYAKVAQAMCAKKVYSPRINARQRDVVKDICARMKAARK